MGTVNPLDGVEGLDAAARFISTPGVTARAWQTWLLDEGIARVPARDLVGRWQRLVVVAPHPDDEVLACGALLHTHAIGGGQCLVVAVSDGEASHCGSPGHDAAALAERRRQESRTGLQRLGVPPDAILRLGLPDGGLQRGTAELHARLSALLRPGDVVLTTWRRDGHPDHEACGCASALACQGHGLTLLEAPVWMWHWAEPWDPQVDWARMVGVGMGCDTLARKLHALAAHRSQLAARPGGQPAVLDPAIIERAGWDSEYFFITTP